MAKAEKYEITRKLALGKYKIAETQFSTKNGPQEFLRELVTFFGLFPCEIFELWTWHQLLHVNFINYLTYPSLICLAIAVSADPK